MPKYEFVAVDFDGTLCTNAFPEIGEPNPVVIGYVRKLAAERSFFTQAGKTEPGNCLTKRWRSAKRRKYRFTRSMKTRGTHTPQQSA